VRIGRRSAGPDPFSQIAGIVIAVLTLQSLAVSISTTCFDTLTLRILPTQCICVFSMVLTINSDCFPKQH
jgi:hypothetical protein